MLTLDYINEHTLWVAKFESGYRTTGTYDEVKKYYSHDDIDEIDIVYWKHQPKELQEFYKAYEYAFYDLHRQDLYEIKDFYEEWSKNPKQFTPDYKPVIGKLSEYIESIDPCDDLSIPNYYGYEGAGNHHAGNFVEALKILDVDFDVIDFREEPGYKPGTIQYTITIQTDDLELLEKFSAKANSLAIAHDRFMGDGKYCKEDD